MELVMPIVMHQAVVFEVWSLAGFCDNVCI